MTGPQHYREAEQYLRDAAAAVADNEPELGELCTRFAQAHFTAALVAATALNGPTEGDWPAWREVVRGAS